MKKRKKTLWDKARDGAIRACNKFFSQHCAAEYAWMLGYKAGRRDAKKGKRK